MGRTATSVRAARVSRTPPAGSDCTASLQPSTCSSCASSLTGQLPPFETWPSQRFYMNKTALLLPDKRATRRNSTPSSVFQSSWTWRRSWRGNKVLSSGSSLSPELYLHSVFLWQKWTGGYFNSTVVCELCVFAVDHFLRRRRAKAGVSCVSGLTASPDQSCVYELSAVLIHRGISAYSGHYIAHVKDAHTGDWYKFNDEEIEKMEGKKLQLGIEEDIGKSLWKSSPEV